MCLPWWGRRFGFACLARERALHPSRDGEGAVAAEYATTALPAFRRSGPTSAKRDNGGVPALPFVDARETVLRTVREGRTLSTVEEVSLADAAGRVLAADAAADRDSPALARSVRDGYAVRAADLPGELRGHRRSARRRAFRRPSRQGQAVEIMTGAPIPAGADAVVMVEHTRREDGRVVDRPCGRAAAVHQSARLRGGRRARSCCSAGKRLDYTDIAMLAAIRPRPRARSSGARAWRSSPPATRSWKSTETPAAFQIRNSNAYSLAAQVARAGGGAAGSAGGARHRRSIPARSIARGLAADLLLLSGGVSAGKYDVVEQVLAELGAEFYLRPRAHPTRPAAGFRPRRPETFSSDCRAIPSSTMVTFEIFARAALELLAGPGGDRAAPCRWRA